MLFYRHPLPDCQINVISQMLHILEILFDIKYYSVSAAKGF